MTDRHSSGFTSVTRVDEVRAELRALVASHDRTDTVPLAVARERIVADPIRARRDVPHYDRAAMDGYAVRAVDTFDASERAPAILELADEPGPNAATRVHTGSELPDGADAVVMLEHVTERDEEIEIFDGVTAGANVAPAGEDVEEGQVLFEPGHQLRPSDLGLCKVAGIGNLTVAQRPTVGVVPTGEELVERDPEPGEVVETNGQTVSQYVERWGGKAEYRNIVTDDPVALRAAIERDLTKDVIVTTGGSSVGERDHLPEVVSDLGEVLLHGVAIKPGHPFALGVVRDTPVLMLPGYPVACIVNAVQFLRPAIKWAGNLPLDPHPTREARLDRKVASETGKRTFVRVRLDEEGETPTAIPTRSSGAGVLSSVAHADGWIEIPEDSEGLAEGDSVEVQNWEYYS
jgi:molybdopterin molybdotransferase